jgi:hypothetical protein
MDTLATDSGAIFGATGFLSYSNDLLDPRQAVKVVYPLEEVLLLALLAVLAGAEAFTDIARFGDKKLALLRRFRPYRDGMPPHDRIGDVFAALDAQHFQRCFVAWVAPVTGVPVGVIAIDGKTVRRSGHKKDSKAPIHMVSAFAARQRLVLGQVKVTEKSGCTMRIALGCTASVASPGHYVKTSEPFATRSPKSGVTAKQRDRSII